MEDVPRPRRDAGQWRGAGLALVAVAMATISAWLALPRPVVPGDTLPLPLVDRRELSIERLADRARAESASRQTLPYSVRAVGELIRRFGARQARGDIEGAERARQDAFRQRASSQSSVGAEPLRALRALQTQLFLARVKQRGGFAASDRELDELSGDLGRRGRRAGWIDAGGKPLLTENELALVYQLRWTELVGALDDAALGPKLNDVRAYYRVLFAYPDGDSARERDEQRLLFADALGQRDPTYARQFVRGVLLHRLGEPAFAAEAFVEHLREHPDGPWTLRAQNHLLAMLADAGALE